MVKQLHLEKIIQELDDKHVDNTIRSDAQHQQHYYLQKQQIKSKPQQKHPSEHQSYQQNKNKSKYRHRRQKTPHKNRPKNRQINPEQKNLQ